MKFDLKWVIFIIVYLSIFACNFKALRAAEVRELPKANDVVKVDYETRRRPLKDIIYYEFCCITLDGNGCLEPDKIEECKYIVE